MSLKRKKKNRRVVAAQKKSRSHSWRSGLKIAPGLRRPLVLSVLALFVLGGGLQLRSWLGDMETLTLRQVRVEGSFKQVSRVEIQRLLAPYAGLSFFDLDVVAIKEVLQKQPWVQQAMVRHQWPNGLVVTLIEQQPLARWGDDGLMNKDAVVFFPQGGMPAGLPRLDGVENSERLLLSRLQDVGVLLQPLGLKIVAMSMDERRSWVIELDNGLRLMLGRERDMQRIQRFVNFYPMLLAMRSAEVGVVDLRYPNGIVLRWSAPQGTAVQVG